MKMSQSRWLGLFACIVAMTAASTPAAAQQQQRPRPPNILVIMGDDVGWFNIGAYHRGIMSGKTPNLDKLASEGMTFTDYYAEASCTAGRANFITGELPIRTGLTTVGQAGADVGIPAEAVTLATITAASPDKTPSQMFLDMLRFLRVGCPKRAGSLRPSSKVTQGQDCPEGVLHLQDGLTGS